MNPSDGLTVKNLAAHTKKHKDKQIKDLEQQLKSLEKLYERKIANLSMARRQRGQQVQDHSLKEIKKRIFDNRHRIKETKKTS